VCDLDVVLAFGLSKPLRDGVLSFVDRTDSRDLLPKVAFLFSAQRFHFIVSPLLPFLSPFFTLHFPTFDIFSSEIGCPRMSVGLLFHSAAFLRNTSQSKNVDFSSH